MNVVLSLKHILTFIIAVCIFMLNSSELKFANVTYATRDGVPLMLDVYWPNTMKAEYIPTMVYIHGGGWENGSRTAIPSFIYNVSGNHNYILVSIDYRLTTQAGQYNNDYVTFPGQINDVISALTFLKQSNNAKMFRIDINKIGCWGDSAGSHLCILIGTYGSDSINTNLTWSIGYYTPTDILYMEIDCNNTGVGCDFNHDYPGSPETNLIGWSHGIGDLRINQNNTNGPYPYFVDLVNFANPINYATKERVDILPAFFIAHGTADTTVPYLQSTRLIDQLKTINHPNYRWYPCNCTQGCQHAHNPKACWKPVDEALDRWLDQFN